MYKRIHHFPGLKLRTAFVATRGHKVKSFSSKMVGLAISGYGVLWQDSKTTVSGIAVLLLLSGCAGTATLNQVGTFNEYYAQGDYAAAAKSIGGKGGLDYDEENLILALHAGSAQFASGMFENSIVSFDRAEQQLLWKADKVDSVAEASRAVGTFLTSDLAAKYTGKIYEGALLNTYKALAAIHLGDMDQARIEFNRASVRQENAVYQLAAKVEKLDAADEEDAENGNHSETADVTTTKALAEGSDIEARLSAAESIKKYKNLRNPLSDYLHGIFRLVNGEPNHASDLLRNAAILTDRNPHVVNDLLMAEQAANQTSGEIGPRIWVIYEDGAGPTLGEFRVDLPVYLVSNDLFYAGFAIPEFISGHPVNGNINVVADGQLTSTRTVLELDRLVSTEFATTYRRVVTKAIASAVVKAIIAERINEESSDQGGYLSILTNIATAVVQAQTTKADTRIWRALPHTVNVASVPYPADGIIELRTSNGGMTRIDLDSAGYNAGHIIITAKATLNNQITFNIAKL